MPYNEGEGYTVKEIISGTVVTLTGDNVAIAWERVLNTTSCMESDNTASGLCEIYTEVLADDYRYGFNGKEKDNELSVEGGSYDFGARIYDARLGRWLSTDPLSDKYPGHSPYTYALNSPIMYIDEEGKDNVIYLVVLPGSTASIVPGRAEKIRDEANRIYQQMGLKTRVVIWNSDKPIPVSKLDATDGVAVLGKDREATENYIFKYVDKLFVTQKLIDQSWGPERSSDRFNKRNVVAIREDVIKQTDYGYKSMVSDRMPTILGFLIAHGTGHNAGADANPWGHKGPLDNRPSTLHLMMSGAQLTADFTGEIKYDAEEQASKWPITPQNECLEDILFNNAKSVRANMELGEKYWKSKDAFGDNPAKENYQMQMEHSSPGN